VRCSVNSGFTRAPATHLGRDVASLEVSKAYAFDGPEAGRTLGLFEGAVSSSFYRAFFRARGVRVAEHALPRLFLRGRPGRHSPILNARDTTLAYRSRAPQEDIARLQSEDGREMPWTP